MLRRNEKWNFKPDVTYELDASGDLFWTRMKSNSRLEQFKALAYDAFREARFKFRLCQECKRPFVPVRRQAYCSAGCSQAVRTRKWRKAHPEKNRAIRRQQYQRAKAGELRLSKHASIKMRNHANDHLLGGPDLRGHIQPSARLLQARSFNDEGLTHLHSCSGPAPTSIAIDKFS